MKPAPRLVAVTDAALLARPDFIDRLTRLAEAGCPAVWLRRRPAARPLLSDREFTELCFAAREICGAAGIELWIGARSDIARAVGANGVQLPEEGLSIAGARRIVGKEVRVGRSVHSAEAALRAVDDGADHLVVGTIFATESHPDARPGGVSRIARIREAIPGPRAEIPLLAIGGLTPDRVDAVLNAGAHGVVALTALWYAENPDAAVRRFTQALP